MKNLKGNEIIVLQNRINEENFVIENKTDSEN